MYSSDCGLKIKDIELPIDTFWIVIKEEYPSLAKKANNFDIILCELRFSIHNNIIPKYEHLRCIEEEMRVCLSEIRPNIESIAKNIMHMF